MANVTEAEMSEFSHYQQEYVQMHIDALSLETGTLIRQYVIVDLRGLGMAHSRRDIFRFFKATLRITQVRTRVMRVVRGGAGGAVGRGVGCVECACSAYPL